MMQTSRESYFGVLREAGTSTWMEQSAPPRSKPTVSPILTLDVGYHLLALLDDRIDGSARSPLIAQSRRTADELCLMRPLLRIRQNFNLPQNYCRALINGVPIADFPIDNKRLYCISLDGEKTGARKSDRAQALCRWDRKWIDTKDGSCDRGKWFCILSPEQCLETWVVNLFHDYGHLLLSHKDVEQRLQGAARCRPKLVRQVVPRIVDIPQLGLLLRHLIRRRLPTADMVSILEILAAQADKRVDIEQIAALVQSRIFRKQLEQLANSDGEVPVIMLTSAMTAQLIDLAIEYPYTSRRCTMQDLSAIRRLVHDACNHVAVAARSSFLMVPSILFDWFVSVFGYKVAGMHVLLPSRLPKGYRAMTVGRLDLPHPQPD